MRLIFLIMLFTAFGSSSYGAHFLEPLGTEIASTPPRGRFFLQGIYSFRRTEAEEEVDEHLLPIELEFGVGERTQLNVEAEVLIAEREEGNTEDSGIEEVALGIKHRFFAERGYVPDIALEFEVAPVTEMGDGQAVGGAIILSKFLGRWLVAHVNVGYEFEREGDGETELTNTLLHNYALLVRALPDRVLIGSEINAEHRFIEDGPTIDEIVVVPQFIIVPLKERGFSFKFGVPIGITQGSSTPDYGIKGGISVLF